MPSSFTLCTRFLLVCVLVCAAVASFVTFSDAARASTKPAQEENEVKHTRLSHNPYSHHPHLSPGLLSIQTESGLKSGTNSNAEATKKLPDKGDFSVTGYQSHPVQSIQGSFISGESHNDRHTQSQLRITRMKRGNYIKVVKPAGSVYSGSSQHRGQTFERQQATTNHQYLSQTQAPSNQRSNSVNIQNADVFGRYTPSDRPGSIHKVAGSASVYSTFPPIIRKASQIDFTAGYAFHQSPSFSLANPSEAQELYERGKVPRVDSPTATESRTYHHSERKTVLQSSNPSPFSSQSGRYWSSSLPSSGRHYGGYKETNELAVPRTWSASSRVQSGKFPVFKSQTAPYAPSISDSVNSSTKHNLRPDRLPPSITNFSQGKRLGPHSVSSSEKPTYRKVQSYLFKNIGTAVVEQETVNKVMDDGQKTLSGLSTFPVTPSKQSPRAPKVYSRLSSTFDQLDMSNEEDPINEIQYPSNNANLIYRNVSVAQYGSQTYSKKTAGGVSKYQPLSIYDSPLVTAAHTPSQPSLSRISEKGKDLKSLALIPRANPQGSDKIIVRSQVRTKLGELANGFKPGQSTKNIYGFRGFKYSPRLPTLEENGKASGLSSRNTDGSTNSLRYSFDKTMDYRLKSANVYPSLFPKYGFGQSRAAPTSAPPPPAVTDRRPTDYSGPNVTGDGGATDTTEPASMSSVFLHNRASPREYKYKTSANVFDFPGLPVVSKTSPTPGISADDIQTTSVFTPRAFKSGLKDAQPILTEGNVSVGNNPDQRHFRGNKRKYALKGFYTQPFRTATSEQVEGAKTLVTGTDKSDTVLQGHESFGSSSSQVWQPKSGIVHRRYEPFSFKGIHKQNPAKNSPNSTVLEAGIYRGNGKNVTIEEMRRPDVNQSISHSSTPTENEAIIDKTSSRHVNFTTENSDLGPKGSDADPEEATSEFNPFIPSTYKLFRGFNLSNDFYFPTHSEVKDVQGSEVSSKIRLSNVDRGSDGNQTETEPTNINATSTQSLNDLSSKDLKLRPKTAGSMESVMHAHYELDRYKKSHKTYAFLGFQSAQNKIEGAQNKEYENNAEQNITTALPTPEHSLSVPESAGDLKDDPLPAESTEVPKPRARNNVKPDPMRAKFFSAQRSTYSMVRGTRVKGKNINGQSHIESNDTSLTIDIGNTPIVRLPKRPIRVGAIMYADILGSASFSGIRGQREDTPADTQLVTNTTAITNETAGIFSVVDAPLSENALETSAKTSKGVKDIMGKDGSTEAEAEGEIGDFSRVEAKKSGTEIEDAGSEMKSSDALLGEEGSGGLDLSDDLPAMLSAVSKNLGEDLLELDHLRTSAGNASFKSMELSR